MPDLDPAALRLRTATHWACAEGTHFAQIVHSSARGLSLRGIGTPDLHLHGETSDGGTIRVTITAHQIRASLADGQGLTHVDLLLPHRFTEQRAA